MKKERKKLWGGWSKYPLNVEMQRFGLAFIIYLKIPSSGISCYMHCDEEWHVFSASESLVETTPA